jgi:hypothetical protein
MIKIFSIHTWYPTNQTNLSEHDEKVNTALEGLQQNDCVYLSHRTFMLDKILRTEILYKEQIARKVLFEKVKRD